MHEMFENVWLQEGNTDVAAAQLQHSVDLGKHLLHHAEGSLVSHG